MTHNYASGLDNTISRLSSLELSSTVLEEYSYLGLGTVVVRAHPQPGVDLSFVKLSGESVGDAGDQYTGLDRFGRIVDQRWRAGSTDKDRYQYTYDRNSNRTAETNVLSSSFNETYTYDSLNQLSSFNRNSGARTQSWDYDALGNWDGVTTNGNTQTRTHNKQNEITAVSGATTPVFDAAGNMTTDETGKQYVYDAWNRLVTVKNSGGTTIASYAYDALTRRVSETASSVTTDLYYSVQWQVVEEHVSGTARISYVWSPVYIDAMVARDRDSDNNGSLDERLYVTHDANFNVGALIDTSGAVVERFAYDPFGVASYLNASFGSISASTVAWKYLHQGGRLNADSGFYSFRYREYSPTLGRWVTMDPIGFRDGANHFIKVHNKPISTIDSFGLMTSCIGVYFTFVPLGIGAGASVHYCEDECGNYAYIMGVSGRVGFDNGLGAQVTKIDGGVKAFVEGYTIDINISPRTSFGIGPEFGIKGPGDGEHASIGPSLGVGSIGANASGILTFRGEQLADFSKGYPCPNKNETSELPDELRPRTCLKGNKEKGYELEYHGDGHRTDREIFNDILNIILRK